MAAGDITHAELVGTLCTGTLATVYTVPASRVLIGLETSWLNVHASTTYYREMQIIPTGQSAGDRYKVLNDQSAGGNGLLPGEPRPYNMNPMAAAGAFIQVREAGGNANVLSVRFGITLKEV